MGLLQSVRGRFARRAVGTTGNASPVRRRRAMRPHIDMPSPREAPEHVVARLRDVDPNVDLYYLGLGVWVMYCYAPNAHRRKVAERLLASELARPVEKQTMGRLKMARLFQAGMRFLDFVDDGDVESQKVVRDFRYADWRYRHCADEAFEENLKGSDDQTDLENRIKLLMDFNQSELPSIWSYAFGGRRSILQR